MSYVITAAMEAAYYCHSCNGRGRKLWRPAYETSPLWCAACGMSFARLSGEVSADGTRPGPCGPTDNIRSASANLIPAVPAPAGAWPYSAVPDDAVAWWRALPTYPPSPGAPQQPAPPPECCFAGPGDSTAKRAYAAYNRTGTRQGLAHNGLPCPSWGDLETQAIERGSEVTLKWQGVVDFFAELYGAPAPSAPVPSERFTAPSFFDTSAPGDAGP